MTEDYDPLYRLMDSLDRKVSEGFDRVQKSVENMVTKDAFRETVARLDAKDSHLEEKLDAGIASIKGNIGEVRDEITKDMQAGFEDIKADAAEKETKSRWIYGTLLGVAAIGLPLLYDWVIRSLF